VFVRSQGERGEPWWDSRASAKAGAGSACGELVHDVRAVYKKPVPILVRLT
jgi:hypothetical protein